MPERSRKKRPRDVNALAAPADGLSTSYSPAPCRGIKVKKTTRSPDPAHIATSYMERQNLTIRMSMRRYTRLANAFSKKLENLTAAVSLHFMYYNFAGRTRR